MDNVHNIDFTQTLEMHVIANIPTISSHIIMCTNNKIAVLCAYVIGPIARPGARGLGPGLGLTYNIVLLAGPGMDILVAGRAGPGSHNSICGPGPGQVFTTAAGPGRAWASNHICGPGLGLDFRPVQDTSRQYDPIYACVSPRYKQITARQGKQPVWPRVHNTWVATINTHPYYFLK